MPASDSQTLLKDPCLPDITNIETHVKYARQTQVKSAGQTLTLKVISLFCVCTEIVEKVSQPKVTSVGVVEALVL